MKIIYNIRNRNNRAVNETKSKVWGDINRELAHNRRNRTIQRAITIISSSAAIVAIALLLLSKQDKFDANPLILNTQYDSYENLRHTTLYLKNDTISIKNAISQFELTKTGDLILPDNSTYKLSDNTIRVEVPEQCRTTIKLSDGSKVHLNSKSSISIPVIFDDNTRDVALSGEGFFDIAKDPNRTFIVHTKKFNANVHGTKFNIEARNYRERSNIVLVEGAVSLESGNEMIDMERNTVVEFIENSYQIREVDSEKYYAWIDNVKIVDNEPLYRVVQWLSDHYNLNVTVDRESKDILLRGKLEIKTNPYRVIEIIAEITGLKVVNYTDKIVLTSKNQQLPMR